MKKVLIILSMALSAISMNAQNAYSFDSPYSLEDQRNVYFPPSYSVGYRIYETWDTSNFRFYTDTVDLRFISRLMLKGAASDVTFGDGSYGTLTSSIISEGSKLFFTEARARASVSLTTIGVSGAATYSNSTGVLNIPQYPAAEIPSQTGQSGKFLTTNGSATSWSTITGYLQGDVSSATVSGTALQTAYTITHGLSYTPVAIAIQAKSANAAALSYISAITSTTFTVTFLSIPVLGTNNISFYWTAYK